VEPSALTFGAGCGLLVPASFGLLLTRIPTLICPFPFFTSTPALLLASLTLPILNNHRLAWLAVVIPVLFFFSWNPSLFRGQTKLPWRSLILLAVMTAVSVVWFTGGWKNGIEYQGARYTYAVCVANILWLVLLSTLLVRAWRKPSFVRNLLFHWILFAWVAWYAFPYLGELP
jgi:hypothetical protein